MTKKTGIGGLVAAGLILGFAGTALAEECTPSQWGADDQIGAANLITPESVLAATELVKKGETVPLGIVIDPQMPAFPPRGMMMQIVQPGQQSGRFRTEFGWDITYLDDVAQLWWGTGPQIDGLGHLGERDVYYNCNKGVDFADISGLKKLGIHQIPPLVGRGVVIDMAKHFGVEHMASGQAFGSDDIKAAAKEQGVEIQKGDIVLFHTGWTDAMLDSDPTAWVSGEPGINNEGAVYIASLSPIAVGADTWGLDVVPPPEGDKVFYAHVTFLKENGIYILETMDTGRLVEKGVNEFMFVLGAARMKGAVQMMINPVALY